MSMPRVDGPLCRDCGVASFRDLTALTLFRGWWSPFSIFIAPVVIALNLVRRRKVANLPPPRLASALVDPNILPLPPVRPVLARRTSWIGIALLVGIAGFFALRQTGAPDAVPGCARNGMLVDCAKSHDYRVVWEAGTPQECMRSGYESLEVRMRYYCLSPERT